MYKKLLSLLITLCLFASSFTLTNATEINLPSFITLETKGLFAHGVSSETDCEGWQLWQNRIEEEYRGDLQNGDSSKKMVDIDPNIKYFFIPSGMKDNQVEIYNGFEESVTINSTIINAKTKAIVEYSVDTSYDVTVEEENFTLIFKKSTAESAIYINNPDADGNGTELYKYLCESKENSASASAVLLNKDGTVDSTSVKKIKGRGNTTWLKEKKPFNITYNDSVTIDTMAKGKKFTLLANYQDGALIRNRLLYDLSDTVGMPYASDSRFTDLYMNGVYYGSYQICQKIEVGKNDLINDIDDEAYLNEDNTIATDFPFLMEIDPSASSDDFNFYAGNNAVTVKAPELSKEDTGYEEVKKYVTEKFENLCKTLTFNATKEKLEKVIDIDSFTKIYLINELGKNWDSGVSSLYMVYKQDDSGNWKFFASPVWDYDNSLGNCNGQFRNEKEQENYKSPKNWWCTNKGSNSNIITKLSVCRYIKERSAKIWFENFVPALNILFSENISKGEIYSTDVYYELLKGSAECNYTRGWFLDTNDVWIADHDKLTKGTYDTATHKYVEDLIETTYTVDFKGEFDFAIDWLKSRSGWLSSMFKESYIMVGDANLDDTIDINDATQIQKIVASYSATEKQIKSSDTNNDSFVNVRDVTYLQRKLAGMIQ